MLDDLTALPLLLEQPGLVLVSFKAALLLALTSVKRAGDFSGLSVCPPACLSVRSQ